ncbi:MAG TPA: metallophosphoesterase [Polaromonas sp.]|uniref:metallophosphoesterase family protein n=1 Tax=Polaromonas sp. TaxID=1869339 RepID=UPI002D41A2C8|nr:metallophosphoesterase [Polaromonas sp.]HYW58799.1 metallophosphoesterase [Polaromonas sp.]
MTRLLQISDPHFGTAQVPVMDALVQMAREQRPEVLVLSGDITQRAGVEQFRQARAFCDRLEIPRMLTLPGNHDIPLYNLYQRAFKPYSRYLQFFGPEVETSLETPWLSLIGVKTTRRWRHKNGEVSSDQIERVVAHLQKARPEQLRVVVVHQPVHVQREEDEHDRLRGSHTAVRAWSEAGADVVMGGHIHLPYVCDLAGLVGGIGRRIWCVQAGTALSSRIREEAPNSVNLLHVDAVNGAAHCRVDRWDFHAGTGTFVVAKTHDLQLDRSAADRA